MAQHCKSAALIVACDAYSFGAQAPLNAKIFMFSPHQANGVTAQKHLLLSKSILEKLFGSYQAFVLEQVHLQGHDN